MKAQDLRLGNSIFNGSNKVIKVTPEVLNDFILRNINAQPIPLTEEWLLKLGFKCQDSFGRSWSIGKIPVWFENRTISLRHYDYYEIKYVHSLQNLIHAITGEELTIKQ